MKRTAYFITNNETGEIIFSSYDLSRVFEVYFSVAKAKNIFKAVVPTEGVELNRKILSENLKKPTQSGEFWLKKFIEANFLNLIIREVKPPESRIYKGINTSLNF